MMGQDPGDLLRDFVLRRALDARSASAAGIRGTDTLPAWRERRGRVRDRLLDSLGGIPPRPPPQALLLRRAGQDGHIVETVRLEGLPGMPLDVDVHLPAVGNAPHPAVLFTTGHGGKQDPDHRLPVLDLVAAGFAVAVFDCIGRGERADGGEHFDVGPLSWLAGGCLERYFVFDSLLAMDHLCARPDVDPRRIGCTGVSGGGHTAIFHAALDDRVACVVPACTVASFTDYLAIGYTGCPEYYPVGLLGEGIDVQDLLCLSAPRPLLFLSAGRDILNSVASMRESVGLARGIYALYGAEDDIGSHVDPEAGHGYGPGLRRAMVEFLEARLEPGRPGPAPAAGIPPGPGPGPDPVPAAPPRALHGHEAARASGFPAAGALLAPEDVEELRGRLGLRGRPVRWSVLETATTPMGVLAAEATTLSTEPGIFVPLAVVRPTDGTAVADCLLLLSDRGRGALLSPGGYGDLSRPRTLAVAVEPRGTGATRPAPAAWDLWPWCSADRAIAGTAIALGYPVAGQRTFDALAAVGHLRDRYGWTGPVRIRGEGRMAVVAWLTALLLGRDAALESDPDPLRTLALDYMDLPPGIAGLGKERT